MRLIDMKGYGLLGRSEVTNFTTPGTLAAPQAPRIDQLHITSNICTAWIAQFLKLGNPSKESIPKKQNINVSH